MPCAMQGGHQGQAIHCGLHQPVDGLRAVPGQGGCLAKVVQPHSQHTQQQASLLVCCCTLTHVLGPWQPHCKASPYVFRQAIFGNPQPNQPYSIVDVRDVAAA